MAGPGKQGHGVGDHRRQEGDVFRILFQDFRGDVHQVVEPAGHLHCRDCGDNPHDDEDDVHRDGARLDAEKPQDQHAEAAGKADADASQACAQPDEKQHDQQFDDPHAMSPLLFRAVMRSIRVCLKTLPQGTRYLPPRFLVWPVTLTIPSASVREDDRRPVKRQVAADPGKVTGAADDGAGNLAALLQLCRSGS